MTLLQNKKFRLKFMWRMITKSKKKSKKTSPALRTAKQAHTSVINVVTDIAIFAYTKYLSKTSNHTFFHITDHHHYMYTSLFYCNKW